MNFLSHKAIGDGMEMSKTETMDFAGITIVTDPLLPEGCIVNASALAALIDREIEKAFFGAYRPASDGTISYYDLNPKPPKCGWMGLFNVDAVT